MRIASVLRDCIRKARWVVPRRLRRRALLASRCLLRLVNYEAVMDEAGFRDLFGLLDMTLEVQGDIVECGCDRCGTSVIMANYLRSRGARRTIYACDTFEGFLPEELRREKELGRTEVPGDTFTFPHQYEYVRKKLARLGMDGLVVPIRGSFQQTFPDFVMARKPLSFVLVDCDLEESMLFCARTLWPLLSPGGVIAFDDYNVAKFKGARVAVDRFIAQAPSSLASHGLMSRLYFARKTGNTSAGAIPGEAGTLGG